jgi:hypothetical protein
MANLGEKRVWYQPRFIQSQLPEKPEGLLEPRLNLEPRRSLLNELLMGDTRDFRAFLRD